MNQDLNFDNEVEGTEKYMPPTDVELEFASLTTEEMEARLEAGQPIQNELVAYGLYSIYARNKGFSVRKDTVDRFADGSGIKARDFVCSCTGNKDEKRSKLKVPAYVKPTFRCSCKAKLRVARSKGQNWRISVFKKEHTHDMYPADQTHLLRSARHVSSEMEKCLESMVKCGIPVAKAYDFLQTSSGGRENVGFTRTDIHNSLARKRNETKIENGDASQLIEHFRKMSIKEPYFYWCAERDENHRLVNIFFRDYRCNIDYEHFGDVLSIDTTYRTNKYNLICCPFIGINHHLQNVMFGYAFMSDETQNSFEWLFRTFLESMGGKQPQTIFTDQCPAMMNAVEKVFPHSHHRLCQWHINQNAPSHFGDLKGDKDFMMLWHKCMSGCYEVEEFECTWKEMMDNYDIKNNSWFRQMYNLRQKWASVFSCHKFSAGLKATSRSEGTNSTLKKKLGGTTSSLYDCILAFEKVQESWRMDEKEKDTRSHHGRLPVGKNPWLKQLADVYTLEIYILFQQEVSQLIDFSILEQKEVSTSLMCFTMKSRFGNSAMFRVHFDSLTSSVICSCHKFEVYGILCSHALKVLDRMNVLCIPEAYIIKRWTKNVTNRVCYGNRVSGTGSSSASELAFIHETMRGVHDLATRAQFHKETRFILIESLEVAKLKLNDWFKRFSLNDKDSTFDLSVDEENLRTNDIELRDPHLVRSRGITDAHTRHWDIKSKKSKRRAESSKRVAKVTKQKRQSSQIGLNECPSQEVEAQTAQGGTFHQLLHKELNGSQHSTNIMHPELQSAYPYQEAFLVSQSGGVHVAPPTGHCYGMAPLTTPLFTNHLPWSYEFPFATTSLRVGKSANIDTTANNAYPPNGPEIPHEISDG